MLVEGIHHVALTVQDLEKSREFYAQAFGLAPIERLTARVSKNRGAWFRVGPLELHLQERKEAAEKTEQHLALLSTDLDELVKRVEKFGGRSEDAQLIEGFKKRRFVYDLDQNRIELLER